jgi:hypothetical protein
MDRAGLFRRAIRLRLFAANVVSVAAATMIFHLAAEFALCQALATLYA